MGSEASLSTTFPWSCLSYQSPTASVLLVASFFLLRYSYIMCWNTFKMPKFLFMVIIQIHTNKYELFSRYHIHHQFGRATFKDRCLLSWYLQYHIIPCMLRRCHGISSGLVPLECMVWGLCPAALSTLNAPLSEWVETGGSSRRQAIWLRLPTPWVECEEMEKQVFWTLS